MRVFSRFWLVPVILIVSGALIGGLFGRLPGRNTATSNLSAVQVSGDFREALEVIDGSYIDPVDRESVLDSSVQSMLWTLDPHSSFFTRAELRKLYEEQASEFYGIGVSILRYRDGVYVQSVIPGTPAEKAGLRYGDRFVEVEDKDARDWSSQEVSKNVRGTRGTPVRIKIERVGASRPLEMKIIRGGVPFPSIRNHFMLEGGVGYVGLSGGFQETTDEELAEAVADLNKEGMQSLILDLRGNPGGLLPQAIEVTSRFIPRGQTVVSVKGRTAGSESRELRSVGGKLGDFPMVVLINGGSASASEIVAGAVQDYGRGLVVGDESFGKGLVQKIFPLPYGTGVTLTTARYYTPYGRSLQRDYSSGSIYDYFTHGNGEDRMEGQVGFDPDAAPKPKGVAVKTAGDRVFYGGRGIEPDVRAPAMEFSPVRGKISQAAFFFVRRLVAGRIPGLASFKVKRQDYRKTLPKTGFDISDKVFEAFVSFSVGSDSEDLTGADIENEREYARARLREQLATARYSSEAGQQVFIEGDPQVLRAMAVMPNARKLVETIMVRK